MSILTICPSFSSRHKAHRTEMELEDGYLNLNVLNATNATLNIKECCLQSCYLWRVLLALCYSSVATDWTGLDLISFREIDVANFISFLSTICH